MSTQQRQARISYHGSPLVADGVERLALYQHPSLLVAVLNFASGTVLNAARHEVGARPAALFDK